MNKNTDWHEMTPEEREDWWRIQVAVTEIPDALLLLRMYGESVDLENADTIRSWISEVNSRSAEWSSIPKRIRIPEVRLKNDE